MVCKEDVCAWFKDLSAAKRIDLVCALLQLCLPFEKRFLGSFLGDLCSSDYTALRSEETKANDDTEIRKLPKDFNLAEVRSKTVVILALMNSTSNVCANIMFEFLTNLQHIAQHLKDDFDQLLLEDYLLVMTMAVHHPAFSFSQRCKLSENLKHVDNNLQLNSQLSQDVDESGTPSSSSSSSSSLSPSLGCSSTLSSLQNHSQSKLVHVQTIELIKGSQRKQMEKKFQVHVTWSDGTKGDTYKTYQDFFNFHTELTKLFSTESDSQKLERLISLSPDKANSADEKYEALMKFVKDLMTLPDDILQCDYTTSFFSSSTVQQRTAHKNQKNTHQNKEHDSSSAQNSPAHNMIRSQIIYNSHVDAEHTAKTIMKHDSPGGSRSPQLPLYSATRPLYFPSSSPASSSPLASPMSSPYISPASSQYGGSRPGSPTFSINTWLKRTRLHKYSAKFSKYSIQDIFQLKDEDLEHMGLTKGAQRRFRTEIDNFRKKMKNNTINGNLFEGSSNNINHHNSVPPLAAQHSSLSNSHPAHHHTIYNHHPLPTAGSIGGSSNSSSTGIVPSRQLFLQQHNSNASSREASPSSYCSEDYSSPSDSPQPQLENYSPRVDVTDNSTSIDVKMSRINLNSEGNIYRSNNMESEPNNMLANAQVTAAGLQNSMMPPICPMPSYAMHGPQGLLMHRQMFRYPRTPVINPDGSPGYLVRMPVSNGIGGPVLPPPHIPPPQHHHGVPNNNDSPMAVPTTSVSYTMSQGTQIIHSPGTGLLQPQPTVVQPGAFVQPPLPQPNVTAPRPSTLDVPVKSNVSGVPLLDSSNCSGNKMINQVPGILNLPPQHLQSNVGISCDSNSSTTQPVFHSTSTVSTVVAPTAAIASTAVSHSMMHGSCSPSPSPVMITAPVTLCSNSSPKPHPAPSLQAPTVLGVHQQPPPTPTTMPTPVMQQSIQQPPGPPLQLQPAQNNVCDSPCSECSHCGSSVVGNSSGNNKSTSTNPIHHQQLNNNNSGAGNFQPQQQLSYPHMWAPHHHHHPPIFPPSFISFQPHHQGNNGFVSPSFGLGGQALHGAYGVATTNGISPEHLVLQNQYLTQALAAQQPNCWTSHFGPGHYQGAFMHHHTIGNGGNGGGPGGNAGVKIKMLTCYNCGQSGHKSTDCRESTMDAITNQGSFQMHVKPKELSE